ncbi:MAG: AAA family ATPase [Sulfurimonas sp.]|uniref:AAA family ATPase n=1 Tax=Sulfurimonas sp. TaxID=2022749 RepID=UPI0025E735B2|nr:SbcC/MukB-like Walker B domain-containing protein [Sulfurimonas sp.]MCK9492137.1 AAA family ATPase [Sulfurimonas sp.]
MKILSLKALNINSLLGRTEVDFLDLTKDSALFAITGPTGSGKSTLLDIISCALYGRTSRLKNPNDLMSRHSAEAYCEVEFEIKNKRYRSSWTQKRAHKKHDGKFQTAKMELVDLGTDKVLDLKSKDVAKKVEELSGLDFGRFTQSMLLAQGGFDAFLKADEKERSELLEKITGTQIYADISIAVFDKHRDLKQEMESDQKILESIELLSEEEVLKKQKELEQNTKEKQKTDEQLKELARELNWTQRLVELTLEAKKHEEDFTRSTKLKEQHKESFLKLSLANKALNVSSTHSSFTQIQESLKSDKTTLVKLSSELVTLDGTIEQKSKEYTSLEKVYKEKTIEFEREKQKLKLAFEIQTKEFQTNESKTKLQAVCEAKKESLKEVSVTLKTLLLKDEQIQNQIKSKKTYLEVNYRDEKLNSTLGVIEQNIALYRDEEKIQEMSLEKTKLFDRSLLEKDEEYKLIKVEVDKLSTALKEIELEYKRVSNDAQDANIEDINKHIATLNKEREENIERLNSRLVEIEQTRAKKDELYREMDKVRDLIQVEEKSYYALNAEIQKHISQKEQALLDLKTNEAKTQKYLEILKSHFKEFGLDLQNIEIQHKELVKREEIYAQTLKELSRLELDLTKNELNKKESQTREISLIAEIKRDEESLKELDLSLKELSSKRKNIVDVTDLEIYEKEITLKYQELQSRVQLFKDNLSELITQQKERFSYKKDLEVKISEDEKRVDLLSLKLLDLYKENEFKDEQEFLDAQLSNEKRADLSNFCKNIEDAFTLSQTLKAESSKKLQEHKVMPVSRRSSKDLQTLQALLEQKANALQESIGSEKKELEVNQENSDKHKSRMGSLALKQDSFKVWVKLNELVGSADGTKFKKFAQGITLEQLINLANKHLEILSSRYTLTRNDDKLLDLEVIDAYQGNAIRPVSTLSGGESFIVSLALALGLSELASQKIAIDSLFLDEGFGTLDEESLETALNALNLLQSGGKMVGVISHVEALKERIPLQIKIIPNGDGTSFVQIA